MESLSLMIGITLGLIAIVGTVIKYGKDKANAQNQTDQNTEKIKIMSQQIESHSLDIRDLQDGNKDVIHSLKLLCAKVDMQTNSFSEYKISNMETYKAIAEEMKQTQNSNTELVSTIVRSFAKN